MLERLARWLRVLGVDVESAGGTASDAVIVRRAERDGRLVLTRDRRLVREHPTRTRYVEATAPLAQLREVVGAFEIAWPGDDALFRRCLVCNVVLRAATPAEAAQQGAPAARARGEAFRACPSCGRLYWEGGHTRRMRAALAAALRDPATRFVADG